MIPTKRGFIMTCGDKSKRCLNKLESNMKIKYGSLTSPPPQEAADDASNQSLPLIGNRLITLLRRSPYFVNRHVSARFEDVLANNSICLVVGDEGTGKTELVVHYAGEAAYRTNTYHNVFLLNAASRDSYWRDLETTAKQLRPGLPPRPGHEAGLTALKDISQTYKTLVIIDGVGNEEAIRGLHLPAASDNLHLIVTARNDRGWSEKLTLPVGGYSQEEERQWWVNRFSDDYYLAHEPDFRELGDIFNHNPRMLAAVGEYMDRRGKTPSDMVTMWHIRKEALRKRLLDIIIDM